MKNLFVRTLSGLVFTVIIVGGLLLGKFAYAILFILILLGAMNEFLRISRNAGIFAPFVLSMVSGSLIFFVFFLVSSGLLPVKSYYALVVLLLLIFVVELFRKKEKPLENIAISLLSLAYIAAPLGLGTFLVFDGQGEYNPALLLAIFAIIWTYDSGAYMFGVSLGRHRLFERISPKKSWEGAVGGALSAIGMAWLISTYFLTQITFSHWAGIAFTIVVFSTFGDLTESLFKRQFNLKDSGNFMPGHGGVLDRFDSLLFAVPAVVVYLKLFV